MKNFTLYGAFTFLAFLFILPFSSNATTYFNSGIKQDYNLAAGDTLRITSGNYTGKLTGFNAGAVIIVSSGASFTPGSMNTPSGKIINYGSCSFTMLSTYGGFTFENYSLLNVNESLNLYDGAEQVWNNNPSAKIFVKKDFSMSNAVFTNYASMLVGGNMNLYTTTSNLVNKGVLLISKDFSINGGILDNQNRLYVNKFNAYSGQVLNSGLISPDADMTFNSGTNYTNQCVMITDAGFTNYGTFQNNGLLWVGRTGTVADQFYNSGTFTNGSDAQVKAVKFINYSIIDGGGSYYINGSSYSSGTVGVSGRTTDTVKVYDLTRTSSATIFDVQYGTVNPNVVYRAFAQPDTNNVNYAGCSSAFRAGVSNILPVEWLYFEAKAVQKDAVLNWSAEFEAGMRFDVERSYDNSRFTTMASLLSNNTKAYSFSETCSENAAVVYYRIKATSAVDGSVKYSETKAVKFRTTSAATLTVYPNPAKDMTTVSYKANSREQLTITVRNAAGQKLLAKNVSVNVGANAISLGEIATLKSGLYIIELENANGVLGSSQLIKQ